MGATFARKKPRKLLASVGYRLHRIIGPKRCLNFLLDLEWITHRLAHASAFELGMGSTRRNGFLLDAIKPTERVLDLGCGDGRTTSSITARVIGIDHDRDAIETARKLHPDRQFICAEAGDYLKTAEPFDVLVLSHVLEHLDDPAGFLRTFAPRFARIYVEVPDFEADILNEVRKQRGTIAYTDEDHIHEFDRREIEQMFAHCGLKVQSREYLFGYMKYWLSPA